MFSETFRQLRGFFVSLRLTVALLIFSMFLVFAATLDQTNLGVWGIQQKWFRTFVVKQDFHGLSLPLFPGGYLIGGLLLINLLAAHVDRFRLSWRKLGLILAHTGLILLLIGELLSGIWQEDYQLKLNEGETKNFAESFRLNEIVIIDTTDPQFDQVVAIPEALFTKSGSAQDPNLPFRVVFKNYYANALLHMRPSDAPPTLATAGLGLSVGVTPKPVTYKTDEENLPAAYVELVSPNGSTEIFLVSTGLVAPQQFELGGRSWKIAMRPQRQYLPFSLTLLKFTHDNYAGTDIPKNFASRIRLKTTDSREDREVLIYMNNPLRYAGMTFYQAGFENNDRTTILQVVRNPSWRLPYVACALMALGLVLQFGAHLIGFVKKRSVVSARQVPKPLTKSEGKPLLPSIVVGLALIAVAGTLFLRSAPSPFDFETFGRLPTLLNGRIKPLDTVARSTLLTTQGRQRVLAADGRTLSPVEWLLDVLFRPTLANADQTFEVVNPDVLTLLGLTPDQGEGKKRFSYTQLTKGLRELDRQAKLADGAETTERSPFQRAVIQLRESVVLYQRLQSSFVAPGLENFLQEVIDFEETFSRREKTPQVPSVEDSSDVKKSQLALELGQSFSAMDTLGSLRPIPPEIDPDVSSAWRSAGSSLQDSLINARPNAAAMTFLRAGLAWQEAKPEAFNEAVRNDRKRLEAAIPAIVRKLDFEARFNAAQPFYTCMILYLIAFLLAIVSWLRWPTALGRAAFGLVIVAYVLATASIGLRMWLENRPPVTNLYSSALFVGWAAVGLCLALERFYRNAIGSAAAGLVGFATLLIAHHLALTGDTLEMMRAVLDSNFWLATHVVTVTIGYSATFLAGFLGLISVFRATFTSSFDKSTADTLNRMIYGIVCFATLFSFIGTVLGGIWADQSWGRFWGWDPKENGALLIVIWNALILHARLGGLAKDKNLVAFAIFGNIVTSWSWFGVNMLGIGLHSYGFMESAFWWLIAFVFTQLVAIALCFFHRGRKNVVEIPYSEHGLTS